MSITIIKWDKINPIITSKYKDKIEKEDDLDKFLFEFHIPNLDWIEDKSAQTNSYKIYIEEFNEIQMSINAFENVFMQIDLIYEKNDIGDFPIDMPREFFRFPSLNNPKDVYSYKKFETDERNRIEQIIQNTQKKMNIRNDENLIREHFTKLEFLTLFSSFEAFIENIYVEYNKKSNNYNEEKLMSEAGMIIKKNPIDKSIKKIIEIINPELEKLLKGISQDIFDFFYIANLVRNIHTHKLGRISNHFITLGKNEGIIKKEVVKNKKNEIIDEYYYVDCLLGGERKRVKKGEYFSLKELTAMFRSYTNEIAYIVDKSL